VLQVDPESLSQLLAPVSTEGMEGASGRHQGPAGVAGRALRAGGVHGGRRRRVDAQGKNVILVRKETVPTTSMACSSRRAF
jgi:hypothetical protein